MAAHDEVGVRELRQNLSVYLARVKRGETLTVTEHRQVVAVLRPAARSTNPIDRLIAEGRAVPAKRRFVDLRPTPKGRLAKPLSAILQEQRDEER